MYDSRGGAIDMDSVAGLTVQVSGAPHGYQSLEGNYKVDAGAGFQDGVPRFVHESNRHFSVARPNGKWGLCSRDSQCAALFSRFFGVDSTDSTPPSGIWKGCSRGTVGSEITVQVQGSIRRGRKRNLDDVVKIQERAWKERKFTDAEIVCDGRRMPVHRATLSAASPVFDAAFSSSLSEGQSAVYEIRESTPEAVETMLRYIYTGDIDAADTAWAPLLDLAAQYQLDNLIKEASACLLSGLSAENVKVRAAALRRHQQHAAVNDALKCFCDALRKDQSNDILLALM